MDPRVSKVFDYLKLNYQRKLRLQELADLVELSPFHFQKLFKEQLGESPNECLNRIRLERAEHLMLLNPERPLSDLALDCGFSSLSTFSRSFSQKFGLSPTAYRQQNQLPSNDSHHPVEEALSVEICSCQAISIYYTHTSVFEEDLWRQFLSVKEQCQLEGILHPDQSFFGVFTHIPFHGPKDQPNYYAGVRILDDPQLLKWDQTFQIPADRYASFRSQGNHEALFADMFRFKQEWLDVYGFRIPRIFGFEEIQISPPPHPHVFERKVFIPVEKG